MAFGYWKLSRLSSGKLAVFYAGRLAGAAVKLKN
jgi:hypothetical protein